MIHQTSDGRCLQRKDRATVPVSALKLQFERQEQLSREYDRNFVDGANVCDLDVELITRIAAETSKLSVEKTLQYWGLAEYGVTRLQLRRAGLLLFARDINHWHPRCQVRILRIRGTELNTGKDFNVITDETVNGNIFSLITKSWECLRPHLVETKFSPGALFKEQIMYPEDAVREALINAIAHRDYSLEGKCIEISIYDDRMTVQSPGALLSTIDIGDFKKQKGTHESRNAHITRVLKEIGYVREMGEGMRRIFRLMNDADLVPPVVESEDKEFSVSLFHKSVFSTADQAWLMGYRQLKLSREEMFIVMAGKGGKLLSPQQIYNLLSLHDWDVYRTVFEHLSAKEVIYNTMSEQKKNSISTRDGISKREIPRLAIRSADLLENNLAILFARLAELPVISVVSANYINKLLELLPQENVYKTNVNRITRLLKILGLIGEDNAPTITLRELWQQKKEFPKKQQISEVIAVTSNQVTQMHMKPSSLPSAAISNTEAFFVGNLNFSATENEVFNLFSQYGKVLSVKISIDYTTGHGRGFAFVTMEDRKNTEAVMEKLQGYVFLNRPLRISW